MEKEHNSDFFYECHKCKKLVPGCFDTNATDPVVMVADSKPNTFLFECEPCNDSNNVI